MSRLLLAEITHKLSVHDHIINWLQNQGFHLLIIIVGAWILRRVVTFGISSLMRHAMHIEQKMATDLDRQKRMETFINLANAVASVFVWVIAGMMILQQLGISPGPLMTGAGVLGIALTFGTQSLVKDFISGFFIVMENQYRVGDDVELDATKGTVEHVGIRTTVLRDEEGNIHFIPNGLIQRTTNKSLGLRTLRFSLTIDAKADVDAVENLANRLGERMAAEKKWHVHIADPIRYTEMGEVTHKKRELLLRGKVKAAYEADVSTEFRARLLEKLQAKNVAVTKLTVVTPDEPAPEKPKK